MTFMNIRVQLGAVMLVAAAVCAFIMFVNRQNDRAFVATEIQRFQQERLANVAHLADRLRWQFEKLYDSLDTVSQIPPVQFLDDDNAALLHLVRAYRLNQQLVDGIFRSDKSNRLHFTYPVDIAF